MKLKPRRLRRILKRSGLALCIITCIAWGFSVCFPAMRKRPFRGDNYVGAYCGLVVVVLKHESTWLASMGLPGITSRLGFEWPTLYCRLSGQGGNFFIMLMPFWLLLLLFACPTAWLFFRDRRCPPPGHCKTCGYNLTGNLSGICPECGARINSSETRPL